MISILHLLHFTVTEAFSTACRKKQDIDVFSTREQKLPHQIKLN